MSVIPKRLVPGSQIASVLTAYYTAANCKARIDALALINSAASAVVVSLHLTPSGASSDATNRVLFSRSIAPGETYIVPGAIGQWIEAGGQIVAVAGSAASVTLVASGVEYFA